MADNILEIRHLSKSFGTHEVLRDIDFDVKKGDVISIIGASGSGKSTLLRCINLLEEADSGHIWFDGQDLMDLKVNLNALRQKIGMVFQGFNLFNNKSVLDNCTLAPMDVKHIPKTQAEATAIKHFTTVCLADFIHADSRRLSGGQKQRVAIARALCMEPELLVADEPVASLDVSIQAQIVNLFRHLQREHGFSFLFIAHDLAMVEFLCDRVGVLYHGKLVEVAPVRALYDHPLHPYTKALLAAMPIPDPRIERNRVLPDFSPGQFPLTGELIEAEPDHFVLREGGTQ